jgi:GDP-mannose 6-dehydrogenase
MILNDDLRDMIIRNASTDELRESPRVLLAEHFIGKGLTRQVYDPEVHLSRLLGANRRFIEQHVPHLGSLMKNDIESVIASAGGPKPPTAG